MYKHDTAYLFICTVARRRLDFGSHHLNDLLGSFRSQDRSAQQPQERSTFPEGPLSAEIGAKIRAIVIAQLRGTIPTEGTQLHAVAQATPMDVTLEGNRYQAVAYKRFSVITLASGELKVRESFLKTANVWELGDQVSLPPNTYLISKESGCEVVDVLAEQAEGSFIARFAFDIEEAMRQDDSAGAQRIVADAVREHPELGAKLNPLQHSIAKVVELEEAISDLKTLLKFRTSEEESWHAMAKALTLDPNDWEVQELLRSLNREGHLVRILNVSKQGDSVTASVCRLTPHRAEYHVLAGLTGTRKAGDTLQKMVAPGFAGADGRKSFGAWMVYTGLGSPFGTVWHTVIAPTPLVFDITPPSSAVTAWPRDLFGHSGYFAIQLFVAREGKLVPASNCCELSWGQ
jgi:hypothetical protein